MSLNPAQVRQIVQQDRPVLCLDTCSLLDLMRDPVREKTFATDLRWGQHLLALVEAGDLVALVAEQVHTEFGEHVDRIEQEAAKGLTELHDTIARVEAIIALYGASGAPDCSHWLGHPGRARAMAGRWMAVCTVASSAGAIVTRAGARVLACRTPATVSKNSMKDCVVIETYLEAISNLRTGGLGQPIAFVSSNIRDYTDHPLGSQLRADLATEFAALQIQYAVNFGAAKHCLGL